MPALPDEGLSKKNLDDYITTLSCMEDAKAANKPVMVYFYTTAKKSSKGTALSKQASTCKILENCYFKGKDRSFSLTALFFMCSKVDVSNVRPSDNPIFNTMTVPQVVIVSPDGTVDAKLLGRKANSGALSSALNKVLVKHVEDDKFDIKKALKDGLKILSSLQTMGDKQDELLRNLNTAQSNLALAKQSLGSNKAKIRKLERQVEDIQKKVDELEEKIKKAETEIEKLFGYSGNEEEK
ncbi:coiled-coil domain-containing protein [Planctomycetota bacterium]